MSISRHSIIGFSVSALLHLGLLALVLIGGWGESPALQSPVEVPISLSMFKSQADVSEEKNVATPAVELRPMLEKVIEVPMAEPVVPEETPDSDTEQLAEQSEPDTVEPEASEVVDDRVVEQETLLASATAERLGEATAVNYGLLRSIEEEYKSALREAIEAKKYYPKRARRMRREGLVEVDFTVDRSGLIKNISIYNSSGIKLLDTAALQAVETLRQFRPIPDELNRSQWPMRIPVEFSLLNL